MLLWWLVTTGKGGRDCKYLSPKIDRPTCHSNHPYTLKEDQYILRPHCKEPYLRTEKNCILDLFLSLETKGMRPLSRGMAGSSETESPG